MIENTLMNFLIKCANTPWVNGELPEITNSDSWEDYSYDPEVLANHEYKAKLNALKRTNPELYEYLMNHGQKNLASLELDQIARQYNSGKSVGLPFMPEMTINSPKKPREIENYAQALQQLPLAKARLNDSIRTSANALLNRINPNYSVKPPFAVIKPAPIDTSSTTSQGQSGTPATPTQNLSSDSVIDITDFNKPYSLDDARAIVAQGLNGKPSEQAVTGATNTTATSPSLPNSALTGVGGADVNFQVPPVSNSTPPPAALISAPIVSAPVAPTKAPAAPAPAPAAPTDQVTQNPFYNPKAITREQMRQYRRYTGANDMKSDMDRWKTYQAMNGNRDASNADYYASKRNNMLDKVVNPVTAQSK